MRKLEISTLQTKPTDIPLPFPLEKKPRKQTEENSNPLPHPVGGKQEMRHSDSLNWRERFKERKEKRKTEVKRTKTSKTIEEEIDEEQWKTHTLNPAGTHETAIVSLAEDNDEQENDLLV